MAIALANNCKRVSISSKRQITIPQVFFNALGFENEAECILKDNEIILRPAHISNSDIFAEQILAELLEEGYSGKKLLEEFKVRKAKIRPAVARMISEAEAVAEDNAEFMTMNEVFGDE